jgi:NitT/TauT family transport system substrate-binding protein
MEVNVRRYMVGLLLILMLAGCGLGPTASPTPAAPVPLTVGMGFIPSVQFAPFYRAQQQGYYRDAGLAVTFQHGIDPELITLIGQGSVDIGMADGTSVIVAASQGIPVRYASTYFARFPSVVVSRVERGINQPADLAGIRLGTPGRFGTGWVMLQALLSSAGLTPDDLEIELFPDFGQAVALREGRVDAATGFANNEPVQLALAGIETNVMRVDDITPLPGPGLIAGAQALDDKRDALRAFVTATLRAMEEISAEPETGLEDSIAVVPELGEDRATQLAILRATIEMWHSPYTEQHGLGAIDAAAWDQSIEFMRTLPDSVVTPDLAADQLVTEELLP